MPKKKVERNFHNSSIKTSLEKPGKPCFEHPQILTSFGRVGEGVTRAIIHLFAMSRSVVFGLLQQTPVHRSREGKEGKKIRTNTKDRGENEQ